MDKRIYADLILLFSLSMFFIHSYKLQAQEEQSEFQYLIFEEYPAIIGSFTIKDIAKTPGSVTIITEKMIENTPARNIYDLIEIYVPGALQMMHYDSSHFGIRGLIVDRDYRYLILLNGLVMNQTHNGIVTEL